MTADADAGAAMDAGVGVAMGAAAEEAVVAGVIRCARVHPNLRIEALAQSLCRVSVLTSVRRCLSRGRERPYFGSRAGEGRQRMGGRSERESSRAPDTGQRCQRMQLAD